MFLQNVIQDRLKKQEVNSDYLMNFMNRMKRISRPWHSS
jgi:hypothetical protein